MTNPSGVYGTQLKYGPVNGEDHPGYPIGIAASQTIPAQSGHFALSSSGNAAICTSAAATILGWLDTPALADGLMTVFVSSATAGATIASIILGSDIVFRLPIQAGTFAVTYVGYRCDLAVGTINGVANAQGAALTSTSHNLIIVVGGDLTNNNWVDVIMNPANRGI